MNDMQTPHRVPEPPRRTEPVHVPLVLRDRCPKPAAHYECRSIDGLDAAAWTALLADRYTAGYRLLQVVPFAERALMIFGHDHD